MVEKILILAVLLALYRFAARKISLNWPNPDVFRRTVLIRIVPLIIIAAIVIRW